MKRLKRALLVLDASCVIMLDRIECLEALKGLGAQIAVTPDVLEESSLQKDPDGEFVKDHPAIQIRSPDEQLILPDETLGRGELESMALCREDSDWRVFVTDDSRAKRKANAEGLLTLDSRAVLWTICVSQSISFHDFRRGMRYLGGQSSGAN